MAGSYYAAARYFGRDPFRNATIFVDQLSQSYTGWSFVNNQWYGDNLMRGLLPLAIGLGLHFVASKLGVNRALGRARVPVLRL